jgi:hypothetical protein
MTTIDIYRSTIKPLPAQERLQLMELMARDLARETPTKKNRANIFKLRGLGKDVWKDVDVEENIKESREERDILR